MFEQQHSKNYKGDYITTSHVKIVSTLSLNQESPFLHSKIHNDWLEVKKPSWILHEAHLYTWIKFDFFIILGWECTQKTTKDNCHPK